RCWTTCRSTSAVISAAARPTTSSPGTSSGTYATGPGGSRSGLGPGSSSVTGSSRISATSAVAPTRTSRCADRWWGSASGSETPSVCGAHAGLVDEVLGGGVDLAAATARRLVDVERAALDLGARRRRQGDLVIDGQGVIRELELRIVNAAELEQHLHEVRLALREQRGDLFRGAPDLPDPEVLAIEDSLGVDELLVELRERERGRQDGVLNVEEAIVT